MPRRDEFTYTINVEDFDVSPLPPNARQSGTDAFGAEVSKFIQEDFKAFGGSVRIVVDPRQIQVSWRSDPNAPDPLQSVIKKIQQGQSDEAIRLLEHLRQLQPENADVLKNLGMVLSDAGQFDRAEIHLRRAIVLDPTNTDAMVALGVALARQKRYADAVPVLEQALAHEANNPWAHRNLGACLLQTGRTADAEKHLRRAVELNPTDQQAVLGLGQGLEAADKLQEASATYTKAIDLDPRSTVADIARDALTKLAQSSFRQTMPSAVRPDAVMYLLGALRKFDKMSRDEIQKITFEIGILGQRGLDTNDSSHKYQLKSLPGQYSGLHLVCIMFVGFQTIAPDYSIGFDLTREYEVAKAMHSTGTNEG